MSLLEDMALLARKIRNDSARRVHYAVRSQPGKVIPPSLMLITPEELAVRMEYERRHGGEHDGIEVVHA